MSLIQRMLTFRPDEDILQGMQRLRDDEGVPFSQQIRRALRAWLTDKGVMKTERKPAGAKRIGTGGR